MGNETPSSVVILELVITATASSLPDCVNVTWITEACRPSLASLTVKRAGPASVRRRKSMWRAIECGWFCFDSVVPK